MEGRLARRHAGHLGLKIFDLPFDLAGFEVVQVWDRSRAGDPAHRWLREQVQTLAAAEMSDREIPAPQGGALS